MRVLILGCGDLGTRLGLLLETDGFDVIGARRTASKLPASFERLRWDFDDPASHDALPTDVSVVCWTGAPGGRGVGEDRYRQVYAEAPVAALSSILRRGGTPARVALVSSTSVYGIADGSVVDESTEAVPDGFRGRAILEGEQAVRALGVRTTVLRCGGLYGPGRGSLVRSVRDGSARLSEDPPGPWTNRLHIDDAARAMLELVRTEDPPEHALGVDPSATPRDEVLTWLAARLAVELARGDGARSRGGNKRIVPKWLRSNGFEWLYPDFRAGYGAMLDD